MSVVSLGLFAYPCSIPQALLLFLSLLHMKCPDRGLLVVLKLQAIALNVWGATCFRFDVAPQVALYTQILVCIRKKEETQEMTFTMD